MSHPGPLADREIAELEIVEENIEREIVRATKRGLTAPELALVLRDYADDLDALGAVAASWGRAPAPDPERGGVATGGLGDGSDR